MLLFLWTCESVHKKIRQPNFEWEKYLKVINFLQPKSLPALNQSRKKLMDWIFLSRKNRGGFLKSSLKSGAQNPNSPWYWCRWKTILAPNFIFRLNKNFLKINKYFLMIWKILKFCKTTQKFCKILRVSQKILGLLFFMVIFLSSSKKFRPLCAW